MPKPDETTIDEFFKAKEAFEKESDSRWVRELHKSEGLGRADAPVSTKMQRIRDGESPLIFEHKTAMSKEFILNWIRTST